VNSVLTVERGLPGSHQGRGWETFTDEVIGALARERDDVVFLLWGSYAQRKGQQLDARRHKVLRAPHPSPLSAHRGFIGCGHFSAANRHLEQRGLAPVDWRLPPLAAAVGLPAATAR
jgi:uracil-DNA glycosylase